MSDAAGMGYVGMNASLHFVHRLVELRCEELQKRVAPVKLVMELDYDLAIMVFVTWRHRVAELVDDELHLDPVEWDDDDEEYSKPLEELPRATRRRFEKWLQAGECQCPVCRAIASKGSRR